MADTTALKNRIRAAIKTNDNQEITGPVLQQALLDMVDELDSNPELENEAQQRQSGDSTLQQGINTERQQRQDADTALGQRITEEIQQEAQARQRGIQAEKERAEASFNDLDLIDAADSALQATQITLALRKNDGSEQDPNWRTLAQIILPSVSVNRAGLMSAIDKITLQNKLDKVPGSNLINPSAVTTGKCITSSGEISNVESSNFYISEVLQVNGQDIISNGGHTAAARAWVVYDANMQKLRWANENQQQYTYQEGDAYIRFGFHPFTAGEIAYANYGTVLKRVPYTDYAPVEELIPRVNTLEAGFSNLENNKLDRYIPSTNLINPSAVTTGKYITSSGEISNTGSSNFFISEVLQVNGQDIISNGGHTAAARAWVVYDANMQKLRWANENQQQYTYQEGDAYIRFGFHPFTAGEIACANYGTTLIVTPYLQTDMLEKIYSLEENKLDKVPGSNLINPSAVTTGKCITSSGEISNVESSNFYISEVLQVNGQNIISNGGHGDVARAWVVYDANMQKLRWANENQQQYTYQEGDTYICFGFHPRTAGKTAYANYGTVLKRVPYTDYAPVEELIPRVNTLEENKLDKIYGSNLINPDKLTYSSYITSSGEISNTGSSNFFISEVLQVNGQDIISNGGHTAVARAWVVYDANMQKLRWANENQQQYTYQEGDAYIRFGFHPFTAGEIACANYGTVLKRVPYTDYAPIEQLSADVEVLKSDVDLMKEQLTADKLLYKPSILYKVWNNIDTNRQNMAKLGLSRMIGLSDYNKNYLLDNKLRFKIISPTSVSQITETQLSIISGENIVIRNTPASMSINQKPRILIIGDSVTGGYGADFNKLESWYPNKYWGFAKMLFEMDKIDNGDTGHDALFIGGVRLNDDFTIHYKNISRITRVRAEAKGGAALQELFQSTWGGDGTSNPFYDEVNDTFSILAYLENYRTMDNLGVRLVSNSTDPHGETVTGSDGNTYTIGKKIITQAMLSNIDVCTPTHVFINLNHNTSQINFESNIGNVVNIVKTELPNVKFGWLVIDSTGTNFTRDYPDFEQDFIKITSLHTKNCGFFNYFHSNLEDESNDIYLLGLNFIQPEAFDCPFIEHQYADGSKYKFLDSRVSGYTYHPNNICHYAWGYELYAFIKYLISKDL